MMRAVLDIVQYAGGGTPQAAFRLHLEQFQASCPSPSAIDV